MLYDRLYMTIGNPNSLLGCHMTIGNPNSLLGCHKNFVSYRTCQCCHTTNFGYVALFDAYLMGFDPLLESIIAFFLSYRK